MIKNLVIATTAVLGLVAAPLAAHAGCGPATDAKPAKHHHDKAPKADAPKTDAPKTDTKDAPKGDASKDAPKDAPKGK